MVLLAAVGTLVAAPGAGAQQTTGGDATVRITARKLADGKVEFGLQQRVGNAWGERQLPRPRLFPTSAAVGRWLNSGPLTVGDAMVRITARKLADGKVEFGLQQRVGNAWGERQLPRPRLFPTGAAVGRWLNSGPPHSPSGGRSGCECARSR